MNVFSPEINQLFFQRKKTVFFGKFNSPLGVVFFYSKDRAGIFENRENGIIFLFSSLKLSFR